MKKEQIKQTVFIILFIVLSVLLIFLLIKIFFNPQIGNQRGMIQSEGEKINDSTTDQKENPIGSTEIPNDKIVYLTFDDGPSEYTNQFLDILSGNGIQATFFMQGRQLKKEHLKESVRRVISEGHYVGGHSMTHAFETLYTDEQFVIEMNENLELIYEITGIHANLVRPPYGSMPGLQNEKIKNELIVSGMKLWDWTIDSEDWQLEDDPHQIVENIKAATKHDVEVILMHETSQTLQMLPEIITFFKESGYQFGVYSEEEHFQLNFLNDMRF